MIYRIYTTVNYADTSRDSDNIHINELCYKNNKEDTLIYLEKYIKKNFFHKNTKPHIFKDGEIRATDFCSYGETIIAKPIKIDSK